MCECICLFWSLESCSGYLCLCVFVSFGSIIFAHSQALVEDWDFLDRGSVEREPRVRGSSCLWDHRRAEREADGLGDNELCNHISVEHEAIEVAKSGGRVVPARHSFAVDANERASRPGHVTPPSTHWAHRQFYGMKILTTTAKKEQKKTHDYLFRLCPNRAVWDSQIWRAVKWWMFVVVDRHFRWSANNAYDESTRTERSAILFFVCVSYYGNLIHENMRWTHWLRSPFKIWRYVK